MRKKKHTEASEADAPPADEAGRVAAPADPGAAGTWLAGGRSDGRAAVRALSLLPRDADQAERSVPRRSPTPRAVMFQVDRQRPVSSGQVVRAGRPPPRSCRRTHDACDQTFVVPTFADQLGELGYRTLTFDFRGYCPGATRGCSEGIEGHHRDLAGRRRRRRVPIGPEGVRA